MILTKKKKKPIIHMICLYENSASKQTWYHVSHIFMKFAFVLSKFRPLSNWNMHVPPHCFHTRTNLTIVGSDLIYVIRIRQKDGMLSLSHRWDQQLATIESIITEHNEIRRKQERVPLHASMTSIVQAYLVTTSKTISPSHRNT